MVQPLYKKLFKHPSIYLKTISNPCNIIEKTLKNKNLGPGNIQSSDTSEHKSKKSTLQTTLYYTI